MTSKLNKLRKDIEEAQRAYESNLEAYKNDDLDIEQAGMHLFNEGFLAGLKHTQRILLDSRFN